MQKKSKQSNIVSQYKSLSVQFSLDGFSFCILDILSKSIINFTKYSFEQTLATPELLLNKVLQIFSQDKELQQDFDNVLVVHQNNLSTIVPNDFFDKTKAKTYLKYTVKILADDYITFDDITSINAKNVYIPFVNINNYLFQNFGEFEFKHHSSILIEKLIDYSNNQNELSFFVNVSTKNIDIVVIKKGKLILSNNFVYHTKEDFIYYILFVAEQLELHPEEFSLVFLGEIDEESNLYEITYNYIRNVSFIQPQSSFFNNSDDFINHSNYILTL